MISQQNIVPDISSKNWIVYDNLSKERIFGMNHLKSV